MTTVKELIETLEKQDPDKEVLMVVNLREENFTDDDVSRSMYDGGFD